MSKTLYVSDLDGTLLGADSLISPESRRMLNDAISKGALFSVATARTPATVSRLLEGVHVKIPAVVMTGASLWDPSSLRYSSPVFMPRASVTQILDIYGRHDVPVFIYTLSGGILHVWHSSPLSDYEHAFVAQRDDTPLKVFHIDCGPLPDNLFDRVLLVYAMQPDARVLPAYREIETIPQVNALFYHDIFGSEIALVETFDRGASKADAVERLRRRCGAERVVVFGDNINDLPMMRSADLSVAVANAVDDVKNTADLVIGPNTADSVPRFILNDLSDGNL